MAKAARRYDLYVPVTYNDGRPIPDELFDAVERRLLSRFGGLTSHRREFPLKGVWQGQSRSYQDEVVILTVLDLRRGGSKHFVAQLKRFLMDRFEQVEILITELSLRIH
jgi:hypothetical protein